MQIIYNSKKTRRLLGDISATTLWRYVKDGKLHAPLKPTQRSTFWKSEWIDEFIAKMEEQIVVAKA